MKALDQWELPADPSSAMEAATKQYVDAAQSVLAVVTHVGGDTLAASDAGKVVEMDGGTLTLDASVLTANSAGLVRQIGATAVTVSPAAGTTIYPTGARTTAGQGCLLAWQVRSSTLAYVNGETA